MKNEKKDPGGKKQKQGESAHNAERRWRVDVTEERKVK